MGQCKVCTGRSENHQMFRVPTKDKNLRQIWIDNCQLGYLVPGVDYRLCDQHFDPDQFCVINGRKRLKKMKLAKSG